jgi:molybdopterin-containing oxidoreductase family iron-sulfur binding subunit
VGYWRDLEQLAESPAIDELLAQEFPGYDPAAMLSAGGASRRRFLKLMGASLAMAGLTLTGCRRWPKEHLAPYSTNPSGRMPGVPEQYATAWEFAGVAQPLLVTSYDGRPIKVEGNPTHPASWTVRGKLGSADAWAQATILEMYDPERSREVIDRTSGSARNSDWDKFTAAANAHFAKLKGSGQGFAVLSEATASPSVADMKKRLLAAYPQAVWYEYEPLSRDAELEGSRAAYGQALRPVLHLDKAKVVVSLDSDLLGTHPAHVRYAADWSQRRRGADKGEMNRVYIAETRFSITGSVADERVAVDPARIETIATALASALGVSGASGEARLTDVEQNFVTRAASDIKAASGNAVVAAGRSAPAGVHALVAAINAQIGAVGKTLTLIPDPAGDRKTHGQAIRELAKAMADGTVKTLLILGGNPAYDAPTDTTFADALKKVPTSIRLGLYDDETSLLCKWHLPRAHYLESWGDARSWNGTAGVVQPLIMPLFGGKSVIEVLAILSGDKVTQGLEIVRRTWKDQFIKGDFERAWRRVLEAGLLEGSAPKDVTATAKAAELKPVPAAPSGTFYLKFEPDSRVYDGRFANSAWLQEIADPLTKLVWDNAALISVADARRLGITTNDVVKLEANSGHWVEAAAYVMPGQPVGVIGLSLGYGRTRAGKVGNKLGFNAYELRTADTPYVVSGVKLSKTGQSYTLALTALHYIIDKVGVDGRAERIGGKNQTSVIVREATLVDYKKDPRSPHRGTEGAVRLQLFEPPSKFNDAHAWGMTIDLNTCIGCNACVVACQAENNIGVVGKDQVLMHRQMHWIRIDRYFKGDPADPQLDVAYQPMPCQHCENAPCEQVCPVAATMHDTEGLNTMVYNRCIGTRYCSNNCPYKVRRFNFFDWHAKPPRNSTGVLYPGMPDEQQIDPKEVDPIRRMQFNPEVTVRMRGVMEKCSYCVHRIHRTKIDRRNAGEPVKDGDIVTACQQACPTQAIVFGDLNDTSSAVRTLQKNPRAYDVLGDLNTRPRTRYLAKLRNRELSEVTGHGGGEGGGEHHPKEG